MKRTATPQSSEENRDGPANEARARITATTGVSLARGRDEASSDNTHNKKARCTCFEDMGFHPLDDEDCIYIDQNNTIRFEGLSFFVLLDENDSCCEERKYGDDSRHMRSSEE